MTIYNSFMEDVDKQYSLMKNALDFLWSNPETGFREWKSSAYLEARYKELGYTLIKPDNIPGFIADYDTGRCGPKILVLAELDSLICKNHESADPVTGAVHSCGHCAQSAALLGVAAALKISGAAKDWCGSVRFCAVPAEELIEISYREGLRRKGIIKYLGGKAEFLSRGLFDNVDMAFMIHTTTGQPGKFSIKKGGNGLIAKKTTFIGRPSHAGGSPHLGINALYAANLSLNAINALRETFTSTDNTRVHPIITAGGEAVNIIPSEVVVENFVRGASVDAIIKVNNKVNLASAGSAASLGASVHISDVLGAMPLQNDVNLSKLAADAMSVVVGKENVSVSDHWSGGSTDMGDLSTVMPAIHPYCSGATGAAHTDHYFISDFNSACVNSAKAQLIMLVMLLENDAACAKNIIENKKTRFKSYAEYLNMMDSLFYEEDAVKYNGDGSVSLIFK